MGFGTLLGGYFLLLNFTTYYRFTDVIAALMMFYALYKLSSVNQMFKSAAGFAAAFSAFGFIELVLAMLDIFSIMSTTAEITSVLAMLRCLIIGLLTLLMLLGMRNVSDEVGLTALKVKCNYLSYVTIIVYSVYILLETASLASFIPESVLLFLAPCCILSTLALIIMNLTAIFSCYQKICMPEDNNTRYEEKKSRFGFVNKFRAHEEERRREYAEYKIDKLRNKANKRKNGKKK